MLVVTQGASREVSASIEESPSASPPEARRARRCSEKLHLSMESRFVFFSLVHGSTRKRLSLSRSPPCFFERDYKCCQLRAGGYTRLFTKACDKCFEISNSNHPSASDQKGCNWKPSCREPIFCCLFGYPNCLGAFKVGDQ